MLEGVWKYSYTIDENVNWYSHYGKQYEVPQKTKIELPFDPAIPHLGTYLEKSYLEKICAPQCSLKPYLQ